MKTIKLDPADGWTFNLEEVSANVYRVRGVDRHGRSIEMDGTDPDVLLDECRRQASAMSRPNLKQRPRIS